MKANDRVALYTRGGHDIAHRLPRLVRDLRAIHLWYCVVDGELVADDGDRIGNALTLHSALGAGREEQMAVMAFDLLRVEGEDLRDVPLVDRKECLEAFVKHAALPCLSSVPWFEDGGPLLEMMERVKLEGVVSKRLYAPYRSGRRKEWLKVKCQSWLEANGEVEVF